MPVRELLRPVLDDEALTRGLGDEEARLVVDWLADRAERVVAAHGDTEAAAALAPLFRRARTACRFVRLWCYDGAPGAAIQLVGAERFDWPLPTKPTDACEIMHQILTFETRAAKITA